MIDIEKIISIVHEAKKFIFDESLRNAVSEKGEADFVTEVDYHISNFIKEKLHEITPDIGFMSEEEIGVELPKTRWILDPIDGTTNLVYDYKKSTISLALLEDEKVVFGVVYDPYMDETFHAVRGKGAFLNGKPLPKAPDRDVSACLVELGAGSTNKGIADEVFGLAAKMFADILDFRRICSSALAICYIAAGRINGYFEHKLKPWDYAAATLILAECGGLSGNFNGDPLGYEGNTSIVCGTPKIYEYLIKKLKK